MKRVMLALAVLVCLSACGEQKKVNPDFKTLSSDNFHFNTDYQVNVDQNIVNKQFIKWTVEKVRSGEWTAFKFNGASQKWDEAIPKDKVNETFFTKIDTQLVINPITLEERYEIFQWKASIENMHSIKMEKEWFYDKKNNGLTAKVKSLKLMFRHHDENGNFIVEAPLYHVTFN